MKEISSDLIKNLVKKQERVDSTKRKPWLVGKDLEAVKKAVKDRKSSITILGDRPYELWYFSWKNEDWFCLRPGDGTFAPMAQGPVRSLSTSWVDGI